MLWNLQDVGYLDLIRQEKGGLWGCGFKAMRSYLLPASGVERETFWDCSFLFILLYYIRTGCTFI